MLFSKIKQTIRSVRAITRNFRTLSSIHGQWSSMQHGMAINSCGEPVPWYTYPCIEYLSSFDFGKCDVFEFGSGNSSIFWSKRAKSVVSVEDNEAWFFIVSQSLRENQTILHCSNEADYVGALQKQNKCFEIVVIDGNWRKSCTMASINYIKDGGMIILDNSDRVVEKECGFFLRSHGFIQVDFSGFGPINDYCWTTSIFMKSPALQESNFMGPAPLGGINN